MDPVLRGSPTRDSTCCAQVDVRTFLFFCFLSFLAQAHQNLLIIQIQRLFRVRPSLVRGAAERRRRRLQYRIELYRNAHRRTPFNPTFAHRRR